MWKLGGTSVQQKWRPDFDDATIRKWGSTSSARFQPNGDISLFDDHSVSAIPGAARRGHVRPRPRRRIRSSVAVSGRGQQRFLGSFRRYADGTNVIGWGAYNGAANLAFSEVDAAGHDLLDMLFVSHGNWSYRAEKVPIGSFDVDVLRGTAGLP